MSTSWRLRFLPARESAIDVMKNASSRSALPIVPAAKVTAPTTNAAAAPPRVSACVRSAASAMSAATRVPLISASVPLSGLRLRARPAALRA
jgi:hypothetical protein